MKFAKINTILIAICATCAANAAEKDVSRVAEFANKAVPLSMISKGETTAVTLKEVKSKEVVFTDTASGGELTVTIAESDARFAYAQPKDLKLAFQALNRDETELAISGMRPFLYPVLGMSVLPATKFYAFTETLESFADALIKLGKLKEAEGLVKALPMAKANDEVQKVAMSIAEAIVKSGDAKTALEIFDRVPLSKENVDLYTDAISLLGEIRKVKLDDAVGLRYLRLSNDANNPLKDECSLWALYCEITLGKATSAKLSLASLNAQWKSRKAKDMPYFGLYKMVNGMFNMLEKKPKEALDEYAEGLVYGSGSESCVSELLLNTGIAYKAIGNVKAANEIFAQLQTLYADDPIAAKAKAEVIIPKKNNSAK